MPADDLPGGGRGADGAGADAGVRILHDPEVLAGLRHRVDRVAVAGRGGGTSQDADVARGGRNAIDEVQAGVGHARVGRGRLVARGVVLRVDVAGLDL